MLVPSRVLALFATVALFLLGGCAREAEAPEPPESEITESLDALASDVPAALAGTAWQLVEFEGMDDSSEQPRDTSRYTLALGAGGSATMELGCNRGSGSWTAEAGAGVPSDPDTESGSISFSELAVTQALCPPPSMDEKLARDFQYVTGYFLRGDTLSLSLMADGGIYTWVPLAD